MTRKQYKKNKKVIEAWADGATVQMRLYGTGEWESIENPCFDSEVLEYRIKPASVFNGQFRGDRLYKLNHTQHFTHIYTRKGIVPFSEIKDCLVQFVGTVHSRGGLRHIFYGNDPLSYIMCTTKVDYVTAEYDLEGNLIESYEGNT